jgi:hypothetical protein
LYADLARRRAGNLQIPDTLAGIDTGWVEDRRITLTIVLVDDTV